jgi:hypothetical protein
MRFTAKEQDMLKHRLECDDALAETLELDPVSTYERCKVLRERIAGDMRVSALDDTDRALLADCIEGSTYAAGLRDEAALQHPNDDRARAAFENGVLRVMRAAARKVSELLGREITAPEW